MTYFGWLIKVKLNDKDTGEDLVFEFDTWLDLYNRTYDLSQERSVSSSNLQGQAKTASNSKF